MNLEEKKSDFVQEAINVGSCVLRQGDLMPFSYIDQPIYWEHHEALNITPHPDILILADTAIQYISIYKDEALVTNPGNFSVSKQFLMVVPGATDQKD